MKITRRKLVGMGAGIAAVIGVGAFPAYKLLFSESPCALLGRLPKALANAAIGEFIALKIKDLPSLHHVSSYLLRAIDSAHGDAEQVHQHLLTATKSECESGDLMMVDGWLLPVTPAYTALLAHLAEKENAC